MKKRFILLLLAMCFLGCTKAESLSVTATNFPCYDFARQVGEGVAEVQMLIRPGAEVHSYEPSPADIVRVGSADLFIYIGGESDVWADEILASFPKDSPKVLRLMDAIDPLEEADAHGHDHCGLEWDEHIWTSPKNALKMVRAVEAAMCEALPEQADAFHANADAYVAQIEAIDGELTQLIEGSARRKLVFADRFPFLYLAHDYGLDYCAAFMSCTAESEPSAQALVQLIQTIQGEKIPAVYTIEMSNGAIARTLAEETGAEILTMHSIQTVTQAEFDAGETYVSLMRTNLEAMRKGLN